MSNKENRSKCHPKLPEEVRSLIDRKLNHLRQEWDRRWVDARRATFSKIYDKKRPGYWEYGGSFNEFSAFKEIVDNARAMTREWPGLVWGGIKSTLEKVQVEAVDSEEINAIVDEHAWSIAQEPFTLGYIDLNQFMETVFPEVKRAILGADFLQNFKKSFSDAEAEDRRDIVDTAKLTRERISVDIDEYIFAQRKSAPAAASSALSPSKIKREARKLKIEARNASWIKACSRLMRNNKNMTRRGCAKRMVANKAISKGFSFHTIYDVLKKSG